MLGFLVVLVFLASLRGALVFSPCGARCARCRRPPKEGLAKRNARARWRTHKKAQLTWRVRVSLIPSGFVIIIIPFLYKHARPLLFFFATATKPERCDNAPCPRNTAPRCGHCLQSCGSGGCGIFDAIATGKCNAMQRTCIRPHCEHTSCAVRHLIPESRTLMVRLVSGIAAASSVVFRLRLLMVGEPGRGRGGGRGGDR